MATETVGVRLSLTGARQAQQGVAGLNAELTNTDSRLRKVAASAAQATANLAGATGRAVVNGARSLAAAFSTASTAAAAVGVAAAASLVKTGVAYNDLEQRSRAAFTTILGSEKAAGDMMANIRDFGKTSPFPRQAFISATQQLLGFGFQAKEIIPLLKTINDTTAAVGGNADTIATLTDVFAKIKTNGKIGGDELNRLGAVGVNAVQMIAEATGTSMDATRDAISKGAIDGDKAIAILTDGMNRRFAGASENVKKTWSGALDRVKGAWRDLGSAIVEPFVATGGGGAAVTWANQIADGLRVAANAAPYLIDFLRTGAVDGPALSKLLGPETFGKVMTIFRNIRDTVTAIAAEFGSWNTNINVGQLILSALVSRTNMIRAAVIGILAQWDKLQIGFTLGSDNLAPTASTAAKLGGMFRSVADVVAGIDWAGLGAGVKGLFTGADPSGITTSLGSIGTSLQALTPAFAAFRQSLPSLSSLGGMAGNALTILAGVLQLLANNTDNLVKLAPYLAAGYAAWAVGSRIVAASVAITNARMILGTTVTLANISANRAHTAALWQSAAAIRGVSVAELQAQAPQRVTLLMRIRGTAALIAQRVATVASTVATKAAAAGQWLLNAAMSANPIGLVIAAIALLVGGLVWFFTKTQLGQQIWTSVWGGIQAATSAVVGWFTTSALPAIQGFFQGVADKAGAVVAWVKQNWSTLLMLTGPIGLLVGIVVKNFASIQAAAGWVAEKFTQLKGIVQSLAVAYVQNMLLPAIRTGITLFTSIRDGVQSFIEKVKSAVTWIGNLATKITNLPGVSTITSLVGQIPGLAAGGTLYAGQPTLVGEKGPEVILPQANGTVIPNHALGSLSRTDTTDLTMLRRAGTGTQVIQLVVDRKVLAETTADGLAAAQARR